jgi:hypothetical protein
MRRRPHVATSIGKAWIFEGSRDEHEVRLVRVLDDHEIPARVARIIHEFRDGARECVGDRENLGAAVPTASELEPKSNAAARPCRQGFARVGAGQRRGDAGG